MQREMREHGSGRARWLVGAIAVAILGGAAAPAEAAYVYREIGDD